MAMELVFDSRQQAALEHEGHALLLGAAGSGKTTMLVEKAARLVEAGVAPEQIALATFSPRTAHALRVMLAMRLPTQATRVRVDTLMELARQQLEASGQKLHFASNNYVRALLRDIVREQGFEGSVREAEQIIRTYKSRARKPAESDPFHDLFTAYKTRLESLQMADRSDVIRSHILAMRNGGASPAALQVLLLDNVQDITEIQLAWLKEHAAAGTGLYLAGNDDITTFTRAGALGLAAIEDLQNWPQMTSFMLEDTYRLPISVHAPVNRVVRLLSRRMDKPDIPHNTVKATLEIQQFMSASDEHAFLAAKAQEVAAASQNQSLGLITRDDYTANLLVHMLRKHGFNPASFARLIWEEPEAQVVLNLLYLLLNRATDAQLRLVLHAFEIPPSLITRLFEKGLTAEDWLPRGCPLPVVEYGGHPALTALHHQLGGAWQLMQERTMGAREIFKALVAFLLEHHEQSRHHTILLATDMLLSLSGKLADVLPRVITETMPDMRAPVVVAPVREVRNLEFRTLILPHAHNGQWPFSGYKLLKDDADHERRLFYLALSRSRGNILLTYHNEPSTFTTELQSYLNN